jgi:glycosyltransferase involved in cell wall biosynthesis
VNALEARMKNETVLCIAPRDWDGLWKEAQSIMSRIAIWNRVIYFDPGRDSQRAVLSEWFDNFPNFFRLKTRQVTENLTVVSTPSTIPHARRHLPRAILRLTMPLVLKLNARFLIRHVQRAMKVLNVQNPILWLYSPYHGDLIGKFGEKLVCYYNYDEFANYVSNACIKEIIQDYEARMCRQVDVIFTTSQAQREVRISYNPKTYFVPNAVDFELFNRALSADLLLPPDIAQIPRPIIGCSGRLASQVDIPLLLQVARTYPNFSMVFIGPDELPHSKDEQVFRELKNVHFLGWKKPSELPNYLQAFDAALIPYKLVGHVLSGYPTKLHEYLAAGNSVVATDMPELRPFKDVIRIGKTQSDFVALVGEAVKDNSNRSIDARVSVAKDNTWDKRVEEIYRILQPMLEM